MNIRALINNNLSVQKIIYKHKEIVSLQKNYMLSCLKMNSIFK